MFDLILKGGVVVDGTRKAPYPANVCIADGKIALITTQDAEAAETLDISGKVIAPGFIDIHTHSDVSPLVNYTVESKIAQGVTTEITGNCGISCLPATPEHLDEINEYFSSQLELPLGGLKPARLSVTDYAADVKAHGASIHYGVLVGHGTLRLAVMGFVNRAPSNEEMEQLKAMLDRELSHGAFGMSLGLIYPPSAFSAKEELIELAKVLKKHDALLTVHMRNEGPRVFEALDEMLEITEKSGVHLQISHLKLIGKSQWGKGAELLKKITDARARGLNITCDQYPFTASSTSLTALMPHWSHEGGTHKMMERLRAREGTLCEEIGREMNNRGGADTILISGTHGCRPEYEGKYVSELAKQFGLSAVDAVIKILLECDTSVAAVYFCMNEADMLNIMRQMFICVGSDGYSMSYDPQITKTNPHPRNFSTFPQFLQTVREHRLMPLEDAVYKLTGLPAEILGLQDRGRIREGLSADLVVFDPQLVASRSTFMDSKVRPAGITDVVVNGRLAYRDGGLTDQRMGEVLLHKEENKEENV